MNALVKKEIRLLLPSWLAVLLLETIQPWFWRDPDGIFGVLPAIFFFGIIILAVDSFGREFSLGTFQMTLSQPIERRQIWRAKIMVLFIAAVLVFVAYLASCELRLMHGFNNPQWHVNPSVESDFAYAIITSVVAALIALVGGLWTAILFRQTATAFWITFLAPACFVTAVMLLLPAKLAENEQVVAALLYVAAGAYVIFGFWLAYRLFHRAQDVAWTGGTISFSRWRYFQAAAKPSSVSVRRRKPISALVKKEFQLHSITLFGAGALLVLHLGVFLLRSFYAIDHKNSFADGVSMFFWTLWLVLPLTLGCMTVAEERKLGVTEGQFCLPASRRLQFVIKFIPAMIFGVLFGGIMPVLLEGLAAHFGAPNDFFKPDNSNGGFVPGITGFQISIVAVSAGLSLAAFFASTLAKNFLQALSIAIVIIVGFSLFVSFMAHISEPPVTIFGIRLWPLLLTILIAIPTMIVTYLWLVYRNFSYFHEAGRLWRRNILGIIGALLFVFVSSTMIYNRVWEGFEPAEPMHGPAKLTLASPSILRADAYNNLLVRLPDGRVWLDYLNNPRPESGALRLLRFLINPLSRSTGAQRFVAGSDWRSATARHIDSLLNYTEGKDASSEPSNHIIGYLDTLGVKTDGTLWISEVSKTGAWTGDKMNRFGDETNWQQLVRTRYDVLLLKNDGTLWQWGTNHVDWSQWQTNWPSLRNYQPHQIGTDSDWKELGDGRWINFVRKFDGSVWRAGVYDKSGGESLLREAELDQVSLQTLSLSGSGDRTYVRPDGTLWLSRGVPGTNGYSNFVQVGTETNWTAVALNWKKMIALKSDGSLWQWSFIQPLGGSQSQLIPIAQRQPTRVGIHNDWVAIASTWQDVIALAADGSLWLWPDREQYEQETLLKLPKQPQLLGNVFGKAD